jgi:RNA polymerase sigma-70 factor, ECF subfamily
MLASRARRRIQAADATPDDDPSRQRAVVEAFLAAARGGDFGALLSLLDPDAVLGSDRTAIEYGAPETLRGAAAVAGQFSGRAQGARPALIDGAAGAVWLTRGRPRVVFAFTLAAGTITAIDMIADPERLAAFRLTLLATRHTPADSRAYGSRSSST